MKTARLQAHFARKREEEQLKIETSTAAQKYYDKWGRINSRHENWSTPEYYEKAEAKNAKRLELEQKRKDLVERQERLRTLLNEENRNYEIAMKEKLRPKSIKHPSRILEDVRHSLHSADDTKLRNDMEAKLYSRFRFGMDRDKILLESKTDNHAMAKLSWLDRQVEMQMLKEREKKENNVLELKLQEEQRRHEDYMTNRANIRDSEIKELRQLQEMNVQELKNRERESHDIKVRESVLRKKLAELKKEIDVIGVNGCRRRDRVQAIHNSRRIKFMLRERSEAIKRDLKQDICLLDRISFDSDFEHNDEIHYLKQKFQVQHDNEGQNQHLIEAMYESEAKYCLLKQEEKWNEDALVREQQLKCLLDDRLTTINERINNCIQRQQDLIGIRESHLKVIEDTNERLKLIMNNDITNEFNSLINFKAPQNDSSSLLTKKFDNLMIRSNPEALCVPKFGRKRVLWC